MQSILGLAALKQKAQSARIERAQHQLFKRRASIPAHGHGTLPLYCAGATALGLFNKHARGQRCTQAARTGPRSVARAVAGGIGNEAPAKNRASALERLGGRGAAALAWRPILAGGSPGGDFGGSGVPQLPLVVVPRHHVRQ